MKTFLNDLYVKDDAPNMGAYDSKIRAFKPIWVAHPNKPTKGVNNSLQLFVVAFASLPDSAKVLINKIRKGQDTAGSKYSKYNNDAKKKDYGNCSQHLPTGAVYQEYRFQDTTLLDSNAPRLIHDETNDNFYVTVTHYRVYWERDEVLMRSKDTSKPRIVKRVDKFRNPFYRVKEIPFEKMLLGGQDRVLKGVIH